MPKLKQEQYDKIISDYQSGLTQLEVAKRNKVGRDAVGNILRKHGVSMREYTGERVSNKKWYWNTNFFNERTPTVAYWAGFMMADGSLTDAGRSYSLVFLLQGIDKSHLERFCNDINLPIEAIYFAPKDGKEYYVIRLNYYGLPEQMIYWGIVPRKTYNFVEPQVSDDLLPHYLRGWADGDGQIYASGDGARFTVSGNTQSLKWYEKALRRLGYSGGLQYQRRNENYSVLYVGGKDQVERIIELLKSDSYFKLDRKWNVKYTNKRKLLDEICAQCGNEFGVRRYRKDHPTYGRFCSKKCYYESIKKPIVDGEKQCATCKEWKLLEEFSANKSYCKLCWKERCKKKSL